MYLLFPGRHHLLTDFQFKYLFQLIHGGLDEQKDVRGKDLEHTAPIEGIVFAVTSANHSGTKRNPIPFHLRAMMIQEFCEELSVPGYVFGIDDVGHLDDFASYTLKSIKHQSDLKVDLTPENCIIVCSTPVLEMYEALGFQVLGAELVNINCWAYHSILPWDLLEEIAEDPEWITHGGVIPQMHTSTFKIWTTYELDEKVRLLLSDPIVGSDGDITETRDYGSYVRQMDEIAELKFKDTAPYIKPGRIGDIGCAVGSWIKLASEDPRLRESDFYGIELARQLYDICNQRKHNGEFANPSVFFAQKNAVTDLVFEEGAMDTIHTSSLTHEIESYGSRQDLLDFIENRFKELAPGGVWINRDVIGPEEGNRDVLLWCTDQDGRDEDWERYFDNPTDLAEYLNGLSTRARFLRFARDFRAQENETLTYEEIKQDGTMLFKLRLRDACDFMLTKDYTDNWESEMHETFCFWGLGDWKSALENVGFELSAESTAYTNPWIRENRFEGKVQLVDPETGKSLPQPVTNALIVARRVI